MNNLTPIGSFLILVGSCFVFVSFMLLLLSIALRDTHKEIFKNSVILHDEHKKITRFYWKILKISIPVLVGGIAILLLA